MKHVKQETEIWGSCLRLNSSIYSLCLNIHILTWFHSASQPTLYFYKLKAFMISYFSLAFNLCVTTCDVSGLSCCCCFTWRYYLAFHTYSVSRPTYKPFNNNNGSNNNNRKHEKMPYVQNSSKRLHVYTTCLPFLFFAGLI